MNILMERYHDFCEYYQYKTLPEHHFYIPRGFYPPKGRPICSNTTYLFMDDVPWHKIDLGIATTIGRVESYKELKVPFVFHIDQMPQPLDGVKETRVCVGNAPTLYWSEEEADAWKVGTPIVRPHPIDTKVFKGYNPTKKTAITIATRAISGWGPSLKGHNILKKAYHELPIQVVARDDKDYPNAIAIWSEEEMVEALQTHQVYFNAGWKIDRSPLEAMGCGMPVIAIRTPQNVYKKYFNEEAGNIVYSKDTEDMIQKAKELLDDPERCCEIGRKAKETIEKYWNPELSRAGWNKAFDLALNP